MLGSLLAARFLARVRPSQTGVIRALSLSATQQRVPVPLCAT